MGKVPRTLTSELPDVRPPTSILPSLQATYPSKSNTNILRSRNSLAKPGRYMTVPQYWDAHLSPMRSPFRVPARQASEGRRVEAVGWYPGGY